MNEKKAKEILSRVINPDNSLSNNLDPYCGDRGNIEFIRRLATDDCVALEGVFSARELSALVWWLDNK